jgi:hypothetical protein
MSPHPTSLMSILILSSYLRLGLISDLFPSGIPTKTLYTPLLSPKPSTYPSPLIRLDLIARMIFHEQYRSLSSSLCSLLHSSVTSSLLHPNIPLSRHAVYGKNSKRRDGIVVSGNLLGLGLLPTFAEYKSHAAVLIQAIPVCFIGHT